VNSDPCCNVPDPLADSLFGEYARMVLVGTAACSAVASVLRIGIDSIAMTLVLGNLFVLGSLLSSRFEGIARGVLLMCTAIAIAGITSQSADPYRWWVPSIFFSPAVLCFSLLLLALRDWVIAYRNRTGMLRCRTEMLSARTPSYRVLGMGALFAALIIYMMIVPSISAILASFEERPGSYTIEEVTSLEQLRIRTAKLAVFAIFTYCGACLASFINVVAASAPRNESIALRSSACPKCQTPIRRIDNLPLFSYLNLGGRCRQCSAEIPIRYFLVECAGAAIFGSLFLYELVTGAVNVPGFPHYMHTGILWIILYTKWPVIGIYFYHAAMMSCLLMLGLMDLDRLRCPKWLVALILIVFAALPIAIPVLQPVAIDAQVPFQVSGGWPLWVARVVAVLIGGMAGWAIGFWLRRFSGRDGLRAFPGRSLPFGMAVVGITLGWQAMVTIAFFGLIAAGSFAMGNRLRRKAARVPATSMLLAVVMIHHPGWKWFAGFW
jgi:leader peptidase (prepilin peptidase)/N-methyltransferase